MKNDNELTYEQLEIKDSVKHLKVCRGLFLATSGLYVLSATYQGVATLIEPSLINGCGTMIYTAGVATNIWMARQMDKDIKRLVKK